MSYRKINFKNRDGIELSGRLDFPEVMTDKFAIFAHCFTCNSSLNAVRNVTKELVKNDFAVLQFDFTGLGNSEGDFSDTNFSGNVSDLIDAANYLKQDYTSPSLLVGHSLGGAAVVFAAGEIESITAFSTIGAPANPIHVSHLFKHDMNEITENGSAVVNIGSREFTIKKQFLDDLKQKSLPAVLADMRKSFLILHSPQDATVGIENASEMYAAAHHPKSFVSLDGADHLLFDKADSVYAGEVISAWAKRYV